MTSSTVGLVPRRSGWRFAAAFIAAAVFAATAFSAPPNIVIILADDMGVGDVSAMNRAAAWRTPNLDRLAAEGRVFTDAHSASAVCTPTRYSLLTGRYSWRGKLKSGVTHGYAPALIEEGRPTVASVLRAQGYATAGIGKWHLGLDWAKAGPGPEEVDYTKPFGRGPTSLGFERFFGISASLDMPPYVYLQDDHVASVPSKTLPAGEGFAYARAGEAAADFRHDDVLPRFTSEAERFIADRAAAKDGRPFFLYLALASPHTPIVPTPSFTGKSHTNAYGDFVLATDATVGRVLAALEQHGFARDTVVFFAADNGCSPQARFDELKTFGHDPQAGRRGAKADLYEGGHRVPFIARWPGRIPAGSRSDQLVGLTDLFATAAELAGVRATDAVAGGGEDSVSLVPVLTGELASPLHEAILHHSINGSFAIRSGEWKLLLAPDSGGWSEPRPPGGAGKKKSAPRPDAAPFQLFNLATDPAERTNVAAQHPELVQKLGRLAKKMVLEGRTTPGKPLAAADAAKGPQLGWLEQF